MSVAVPNPIVCTLPLPDALAGLIAGQAPAARLDPIFFDTSGYTGGDPREGIVDVIVLFTINGTGGFNGSEPVAENDLVFATIEVFDSAGESAVFTSGTVQAGPPVLQSLRLIAQADYSAVIEWEGGDFDITVVQPDRLAGTATVTAAALSAGSAIVRPPAYVGGGTVGDTMQVSAFLVLNDEANSPPALTYAHKRDGAAISGAVAASYTLVSADAETNVNGVLSATDEAGTHTIDTAAVTVPAEVLATNLLTSTDDFTSTWIANTGTAIVDSNTIRSDADSNNGIGQDVSLTNAETYNFSAIVKFLGGTATWVRLDANGVGSGRHCDFRIDGTPAANPGANSANALIQDLGGGEWRISYSFGASGTSGQMRIKPAANNSGTEATGGSIDVRAAQLTLGSTLYTYTPGA